MYNYHMYALASSLLGQTVVSLQTGQIIAVLGSPIIGIQNLEILAFHCQPPRGRGELILLWRDVRQFSPDCLLINDESELAEPEDIVRLQPPEKGHFNPLAKPVTTDIARRLGTVDDYTINFDTARIQKLHVRQPFFLSWFWPDLSVDRAQIIDVSYERIIVRDSTIRSSILSPKTLPETRS